MLTKLYKKLPHKLIRFTCVGAVGFGVDAAVLTILIFDFGWGHYISRVVSFGVAVPCTWLLNRNWTFKASATTNRAREYTAYITIQTIGALLNFAIYSACIFYSSTMMRYPVLALTIGSGIAMLFNFLALQRYAFTGKQTQTFAE